MANRLESIKRQIERHMRGGEREVAFEKDGVPLLYKDEVDAVNLLDYAHRHQGMYAEHTLKEAEKEGVCEHRLVELRKRLGKWSKDGRYLNCPCGANAWQPEWNAATYCPKCGCLL